MNLLLDIGLLLAAAKIAEQLLGRSGLHPAVACTLAGAVLGPLTGIVQPPEAADILLFAAAFVFFVMGLDEVDLPGFVAAARGRYLVAAGFAAGAAVLAALAVTSGTWDFGLGLGLPSALALAGVLALSSVGVASGVLAGKGLLKEQTGLRVFTTVIIAETLVLLLVVTTISGFDRVPAVGGAAVQLASMAGFALVVWIFGAQLLPRAGELLRRVPGAAVLNFVLLAGSLALAAAGAEAVGLHGFLGALLLGASLSGLPHRLRDGMLPGMRRFAEAWQTPLFLAAAGVHLDASLIGLPVAAVAALVCIPLAGKFAGAVAGARLAGLDTPLAVAAGMLAKGPTEIAFLAVMVASGAIRPDVYSLLVLVMFGYILLAPPAIGAALDRARAPDRPARPRLVLPSFARHALGGVKVRSVLDRTRAYPGSEVSVERFLAEWTVPDQFDYLVVDDGVPAGIVPLSKARALRDASRAEDPLRNALRRRVPRAAPDEPIDDVLQKMAAHWMTVAAVMDPRTGEFLGTVTSHDLLDLVALMDEIEDEVQRQGAET